MSPGDPFFLQAAFTSRIGTFTSGSGCSRGYESAGLWCTFQWRDQTYAHGLLALLNALPQRLVSLFVPLNISDTSHLARPGICPLLSDFSLTFDFSNSILSFEQVCFSFSHFFHLCFWA